MAGLAFFVMNKDGISERNLAEARLFSHSFSNRKGGARREDEEDFRLAVAERQRGR